MHQRKSNEDKKHKEKTMKTFILALSFLCFAAVMGKDCYMEMPSPSGIIIYPSAKSQTQEKRLNRWWRTTEGNCMLYMNTHPARILHLVFRHIQLGDNELRVEIAKNRRKKQWQTLSVINGSHIHLEVNATGMAGVRIITKDEGPKFFLFYQEIYCQAPDHRQFVKNSCSKAFLKTSHCEFRCKSPEYFPTNPFIPNFVVVCREDRSWSWDLPYYCATLGQLVRKCLIRVHSMCHYSAKELAELIPESKNIPTHHRSFWSLQYAAKRQVLWKHKPGDGENFRTPVFHKCLTHCAKTRAQKAYLFECKSSYLTEDQLRDCLLCRHVGQGCVDYTVYI